MFAAAGTVVTEISTPISGPAFDDVSDSMPAIPARKPTTHDSASGRQMKSVSGRSRSSMSLSTRPARSSS